MPYDAALSKAWEELGSLVQKNEAAVSFLADNYSIDMEKRRVFSLSCNVPAKDHITIILPLSPPKKISKLPEIKRVSAGALYIDITIGQAI